MSTAFCTAADASRAGMPWAIGLDRCRVLVAGRDTAQQLCVLEWQGTAPGGPPLHSHDEEDEVFMVDEGEYLFQIGETQQRLQAGDTLFVPRGVPHAFAQLGERGRLRYLYTPAGRMEDFFAALSQLREPPAPAQAAALFGAYGMKLLGGPLR